MKLRLSLRTVGLPLLSSPLQLRFVDKRYNSWCVVHCAKMKAKKFRVLQRPTKSLKPCACMWIMIPTALRILCFIYTYTYIYIYHCTLILYNRSYTCQQFVCFVRYTKKNHVWTRMFGLLEVLSIYFGVSTGAVRRYIYNKKIMKKF